MNIENFADLLKAARAQTLQQRLLFVFADAVLPDGGCGQNLGLPGGSSCIPTKREFVQSSST